MSDEDVGRTRTQVATPADLAAARESRGMSQVDISHRIKLQVRQVNALEEGQWEALPGKSFVRGALRSYAKLLDVDVTPLLESIGGFAEPSQVHGMHTLESSISRSSGHGFNGGGRGSPILWVIAGLVGVVALVLYFGSDQDTSRIRSWLPSVDTPADTTTAPAPSSSVESPAPDLSLPGSVATSSGFGTGDGSTGDGTQAGSGSSGGAAGGNGAGSAAGSAAGGSGSLPVLSELQVPPAKAPAADSLSGPPVPGAAAGATGVTGSASGAPAGTGESAVASLPSGLSPVTAAVPAGTAAILQAGEGDAAASAAGNAGSAAAPGESSAMAADSRGLMRVRALEDAWVEVRQADGTALHNGMVKAGSRIDLKGNPPYRLVLGNASRVELSYEGKAQDLAPHTRANNIARLQLR